MLLWMSELGSVVGSVLAAMTAEAGGDCCCF